MQRVNVHFTERQLELLEQICQHSGLKRSEIIRRAIDEFIVRSTRKGFMDRLRPQRQESEQKVSPSEEEKGLPPIGKATDIEWVESQTPGGPEDDVPEEMENEEESN